MSSTDLSRLSETRHYAPGMFIHWIFAKENQLAAYSAFENAGFSLKISDPSACSKEHIISAHEMGLKICLRAADDRTGLEQMKALGLDYFPTNTMHDKMQRRTENE